MNNTSLKTQRKKKRENGREKLMEFMEVNMSLERTSR